MKRNDKNSRKNIEGYNDLTAHEAIKNLENGKRRFEAFKGCIYRICELSGYRLKMEIVAEDLRTGKVWR